MQAIYGSALAIEADKEQDSDSKPTHTNLPADGRHE